MHDVDRTLQETSEFGETQVMPGEGEEFLGDIVGGLLGGEFEGEQGVIGEEEAFEQGFLGEEEAFEQAVGESEAVFDEVTEMELAAELLGVQNEDELEQFLGNLLKKAGRFVVNVAKGPVGKALLPVLKKAAKVALPVAGAALGNLVVPGVGGAIGGKLASAAGSMFGLEFEGLSPQDREFEAARRVVRFAGSAAKRLATTPTSIPPRHAIRTATVIAARKHIPGLLRPKLISGVTSAIRQASTHGIPSYPATRAAHRQRPGATYGPTATTQGGTYGGAPTYAGPMFGGGFIVPSVETPSYAGVSTNGGTHYPPGYTRSGRWLRRGRKIVLFGV